MKRVKGDEVSRPNETRQALEALRSQDRTAPGIERLGRKRARNQDIR